MIPKRNKRIFGAIFILLILYGCAGMPITDGTVKEGVALYFTIPSRPYIELGQISSGSFWTRSSSEALGNLAKAAKKMGADAVIDIKILEPKWYEAGGARATGMAIKWK